MDKEHNNMQKPEHEELHSTQQKELLLKGLEKYGSKYALSQALGYLAPHSNIITKALNGTLQLPEWRLQRLELILKRGNGS